MSQRIFDSTDLADIYRRRFGPDVEFRRVMWRILCEQFFQRYVPKGATVMEVGAGYCEFINAIGASRRIAVDRNPDVRRLAAEGVEAIVAPSTDLSAVADGSVDFAFSSNFFEHLERFEIIGTMREVARTLRPGGRYVILQPNFRYCYRHYYMFFDHVTPLDHRSATEALEMAGFRVVECVPRFLPYTTKSRVPRAAFLVRLYLKARPVWWLFGEQALLVAERP